MMSIMGLNAKPGRDAHPALDAGEMARSGGEEAPRLDGEASSEARPAAASNSRLREIRGSEIAMIFQDPMTSLNPVHTVGDQLIEAVQLHRDVSQKEARDRAIEGLSRGRDPARRAADRRLPAPVLGRDAAARDDRDGADQRPELLIADEPTTALDVTTQAQILELIRKLQEEHGTAVIMITHDLGVVAEVADEVVVMYAGPRRRAGARRRAVRAPAPSRTRGVCSARCRGSMSTSSG